MSPEAPTEDPLSLLWGSQQGHSLKVDGSADQTLSEVAVTGQVACRFSVRAHRTLSYP